MSCFPRSKPQTGCLLGWDVSFGRPAVWSILWRQRFIKDLHSWDGPSLLEWGMVHFPCECCRSNSWIAIDLENGIRICRSMLESQHRVFLDLLSRTDHKQRQEWAREKAGKSHATSWLDLTEELLVVRFTVGTTMSHFADNGWPTRRL